MGGLRGVGGPDPVPLGGARGLGRGELGQQARGADRSGGAGE